VTRLVARTPRRGLLRVSAVAAVLALGSLLTVSPATAMTVVPAAATTPTAVAAASTATATNVGAPGWWSGDCDATRWGPIAARLGWTGVGSHRLGASYLGVPVCGPRPAVDGSPNVQWGRAGWGEAEWQCVEVAQRFMAQVYGTVAYGANGSQVVNNYRASYGGGLVRVTNGTVGKAPQPGDIVSFTTPRNPYGHVVVVTSSTVDGNGNGTVTMLSQNDTANGWRTLPVTAWTLSGFGSLTPYAWLHDPTGRGNPLADGTYVRATGVTGTYRIVGGAPVRVFAWSSVGGFVTPVTIEAAQFKRLRAVPTNGTYVRDFATNDLYRIAGGAPLKVSAADAAKMPGAGTAPVWTIDHRAVVSNDHLSAVPADRTQVCRVDTGGCYVVVGGAPFLVPAAETASVPTWNPKLTTVVSGAEFTAWSRLRSTPADGTFVCDTSTTTCYTTAGGAALILPAVDAPRIAGWSSAKVVRVSHYEFAHHAHLLRYPRNGTKLCPVGDPTCYVVAGRAPLPISASAAATVPALSTTGAVRISSYELRRPTNLTARPVNGTVLQSAATDGLYVVTSGAASFTPTPPSTAATAPPVVIDQAVIDNAGLAGRWAHLLSNPALMKLTSPVVIATTAGKVSLSWDTPVASSAVTSYAVRTRTATPTSGLTAWSTPTAWKALTRTSISPSLAPGQTVCFSVSATNRAGQVGPWSATRCTARPLDDKAGATVSSTWKRTVSPTMWNGSALTTTTRLARWSLANVTTDRVGILATTCATCGSVNVFVGSTAIGTINLVSPTTTHQTLILLPKLSRAVTGPLTIVVRSVTGRLVQLDGVLASKA